MCSNCGAVWCHCVGLDPWWRDFLTAWADIGEGCAGWSGPDYEAFLSRFAHLLPADFCWEDI